MLDNILVFRQSSIKFMKDKIIYFDPFKINETFYDADIIFITHDHFDHFDIESIKNIKKETTKIVVPKSLFEKVLDLFDEANIIVVSPNNKYEIDNIKFETVNAYNIDKPFHLKEYNWVGYIIYLNRYSYYIMGDTSDTEEARNVKSDVIFVPIGGTYTMDVTEAANYTNYVKPKIAVPIHYGEVVGNKEDGTRFINMLDKDIKGIILIK